MGTQGSSRVSRWHLGFTAGPYRLLGANGCEKSAGVYFSLWRRNAESRHLELVLDFGAHDAEVPGNALRRLKTEVKDQRTFAVRSVLHACIQTGRMPSTEGSLCLGMVSEGR